jgi:tRNA-Thr(GGU) m(6)t(6)A37 methyltransferase TsaA
MQIEPIAFARTPYPTKFGVPRQPGLVDSLCADVVFEPPFCDPACLDGIEGFERVWLVWGFSRNEGAFEAASSPMTVRPPRLGGTRRVGVFATRSSFRPNGLAQSCVAYVSHGVDDRGRLVMTVRGADMVDGSPIFDVKPYLPYCDAFPDARYGWAQGRPWPELQRVEFPSELLERVPSDLRRGLVQLLRQDPRPAYTRSDRYAARHEDREFWVPLAGIVCRFRVSGSTLTVTGIDELDESERDELARTGSIQRYDTPLG